MLLDRKIARRLRRTPMWSLRQLQHRYRAIAAMIVLCAIAARLIVPSGFMLGGATANGLPVIEICSGTGAMSIAAPVDAALPDGQAPADGQHDHGGNDHPCAFAAASAAVDLVAIIHPLPISVAVAAAPLAMLSFARPGLGLAAPPPPKTGPPVFR